MREKTVRDVVPVGETVNVPLLSLGETAVEYYWQTLAYEDTLKYRLCNIVNPDWHDVLETICSNGHNMFHVVDEEGIVLADYAFEPLTPVSVRVHFSVHPRLHPAFVVPLVRKSVADSFETHKLQSIVGITPVANRAACIFIRKIGFKKMGIIPGGAEYMGKNVDALLTIREK